MLICADGFAVVRVPGHADGGGERPCAIRHIDVGCDVEAREAFVDQLLDAIAFAAKRAGDPRVQRRLRRRQPAQSSQHALSHVLLPGMNLCRRRKRRYFPLMAGERFMRQPFERIGLRQEEKRNQNHASLYNPNLPPKTMSCNLNLRLISSGPMRVTNSTSLSSSVMGSVLGNR